MKSVGLTQFESSDVDQSIHLPVSFRTPMLPRSENSITSVAMNRIRHFSRLIRSGNKNKGREKNIFETFVEIENCFLSVSIGVE